MPGQFRPELHWPDNAQVRVAVVGVTPPGKELHSIADDYATHKHPNVRK
jgi:hypothetical protein